jgi:hypothetical protein
MGPAISGNSDDVSDEPAALARATPRRRTDRGTHETRSLLRQQCGELARRPVFAALGFRAGCADAVMPAGAPGDPGGENAASS